MALLVVAYPNIESRELDRIQAIRRQHDAAQHAIIAPHITLVFPDQRVGEADLIHHVASVTAQAPPIDAVFGEFQLDYENTTGLWRVFLTPTTGRATLAALHDSLYQGIMAPSLRTDLPYVPHATIATSPNADSCRQLIATLDPHQWQVRAQVAHLDILDFDGTQVRTIQRLPLSG